MPPRFTPTEVFSMNLRLQDIRIAYNAHNDKYKEYT